MWKCSVTTCRVVLVTCKQNLSEEVECFSQHYLLTLLILVCGDLLLLLEPVKAEKHFLLIVPCAFYFPRFVSYSHPNQPSPRHQGPEQRPRGAFHNRREEQRLKTTVFRVPLTPDFSAQRTQVLFGEKKNWREFTYYSTFIIFFTFFKPAPQSGMRESYFNMMFGKDLP